VTANEVIPGRRTADAPDGTVVFLIGVRLNRPARVRSWWPVVQAMPKMLAELGRHPELGLLSARTYWSGRVVQTVQYWRSAEALNDYATAPDLAHLPAWREFNRAVKDNGDVGVFHETFVLGSAWETVYVNMPGSFGLGGATENVPVGRRGDRALHRLDPSVPDAPIVEP
jgi:hypothetical protein